MISKFRKDAQGTLQNPFEKWKFNKNRKDAQGTLQNCDILRKIMYKTQAKVAKIVKMRENLSIQDP